MWFIGVEVEQETSAKVLDPPPAVLHACGEWSTSNYCQAILSY